jgi:putative endonuclease
MAYFVYLLLCADKTIYTGITTDLKRRLAEHKSGIGSKYTRTRGAIKFLYTEKCKNRSIASKREAQIKGLNRAKKLELIKS